MIHLADLPAEALTTGQKVTEALVTHTHPLLMLPEAVEGHPIIPQADVTPRAGQHIQGKKHAGSAGSKPYRENWHVVSASWKPQ